MLRKNVRISVVIPVFNVKPYLEQCLDSLNLIAVSEYEVVLVNDGSTDGSEFICQEYATKYSNVVLINKPNGGLSDARNCGTEIAKGEYIYYLDSDDWIVSGAIEQLYRFAEERNCDIVQGGFYYAFDDHLEYDNRWFESDEEPFTLDRRTAMRELIKNNYIKNFAWGKLYKASIVKNHPFPVGKFYEDSYWQHLVINDCDRYGVLPEPLYYYRQRKDSISGTSSRRLLDLINGLEQRLDFVSENYPEYVGLMAEKLWRMSYSMRKMNADFGSTFERLNNKIRILLPDKFIKSIFYKLASKDSSLLQVYLFYRRVNSRLFGKKPQRVAIPK